MVYLADRETHEAMIKQLHQDIEKGRRDRLTKEAILNRLIEEVEKTHKLHGYYFWR